MCGEHTNPFAHSVWRIYTHILTVTMVCLLNRQIAWKNFSPHTHFAVWLLLSPSFSRWLYLEMKYWFILGWCFFFSFWGYDRAPMISRRLLVEWAIGIEKLSLQNNVLKWRFCNYSLKCAKWPENCITCLRSSEGHSGSGRNTSVIEKRHRKEVI